MHARAHLHRLGRVSGTMLFLLIASLCLAYVVNPTANGLGWVMLSVLVMVIMVAFSLAVTLIRGE